jgi:MoaA/NifB/PqqE/SkfB family radical SAM enzyme
MSWETMVSLLDFARRQGVSTLDLTGGAPEMNPHFRRLVEAARGLGLRVIDRCNLTILSESTDASCASTNVGRTNLQNSGAKKPGLAGLLDAALLGMPRRLS